MTEPTATEPKLQSPDFPPGHPLYAPPITAEQREDALGRLERQQREALERSRQIEQAWQSPAAKKMRDIVTDDGNVEWSELVKHAGGILEVVALVDEYGLPDTDRLIPLVDELFNKYEQQEIDRGSIFRRHPKNRPYVAGRGTAVGEARAAEKRGLFPGDRDYREHDAEELLRQEQERRPSTTARR